MKKYSDDELEKLFGELVFKKQLETMHQNQTPKNKGLRIFFSPAWRIAAMLVLTSGMLLWGLLPSENAIFDDNLALLQYQSTNAVRSGKASTDEVHAIEKAFAEQRFELCATLAAEAHSELLKIYVATAYLKLNPPQFEKTIQILAQEKDFPSYHAERSLLLGLANWKKGEKEEAKKYFLLHAEAQGKTNWEKTRLKWKLTWAK